MYNVYLEYFAVSFGFIFLLLIIKEKAIGWVFSFISALIFAYIYFFKAIYFQVIIQFGYAVSSIYAYCQWKGYINIGNRFIYITYQSRSFHIILIACTMILGFVITYIVVMNTNLGLGWVLVDVLSFLFACVATLMQIGKYIENWIYWIVVDLVLLVFNIFLSLYFTAFLMGVYTLLAIMGYYEWKKRIKKRPVEVYNR